ncbi:MAG: hypothetical protein HF967_00855 [Methanosarcinales archaeon]|nr:hypothetical protein [Methanosarcinales archaeon]
MLNIPVEDKQLLLQLINEKNVSEELINKLVSKAIEVRYQDKVIGLKDEISDLIKEFANDKKVSL